MKMLLALSALVVGAGVASQSEAVVSYVHFANLGLFDPLPTYVQGMSDEEYIGWAKSQNEFAIRQAEDRADAYASRHPATYVLTQENSYTSSNSLSQVESGDGFSASLNARTGASYSGKGSQRSFLTTPRWGGGPVVVLNPYTR